MLAGQVYSTISCMLKGILFSPTICSLSEVGGFLDAEELHLSLCSISHSGIYGVYRARCFTHGPALYHGAPLALHPKHYATFQYIRRKRIRSCKIWIEIRSAIGGIFDAVPYTRRRGRGYVESGLESHGGRRILWKLAPGIEYRHGRQGNLEELKTGQKTGV